jgi:hypothetical protein
MQIDPAQIQDAYSAITGGGMIDFGLLGEKFQKQVLQHLLSERAYMQKLLTANPLLSNFGSTTAYKDIIESNRNAVADNYHMAQYRENLLKLYAQVVATSVRHRIDKRKLLAAFFDLNRFSLLKWGVDDPQ